jgi:hypothetical protein
MKLTIEKRNNMLEFDPVFSDEQAIIECDAWSATETKGLPRIVLQVVDGVPGGKKVCVTIEASPDEFRAFAKDIVSCVGVCEKVK